MRIDYPVRQFGGTKSIVISTVSWMGGKQPFLGWAYVATAIFILVLAIVGVAYYLLKPRRMGDMACESLNCQVLGRNGRLIMSVLQCCPGTRERSRQ